MVNDPSNQWNDQDSDGREGAQDEGGERELRGPDRSVESCRDPNRMLARRSPVGKSDSALVSRDYQPRVGGPELIASWPLGPTPSQTGIGDSDWEVTESEYATLQKNFLTLPYVAPIECSILYLNVCGRARTSSADTTLTFHLTTDHVEYSGEPYETAVELSDVDGDYFVSPMVEFAPDTGGYRHGHDIVAGYELEAKAVGETGYVDQGTAVQLWSE
ncbi:hypothetical protein [Haloarcula montana]|uniref:hypothetical protein n=1 Tax=Haloarcula montana TaxID=3111776 RepID=UPI002D79A706|nr:hypothetical protein [Haloarcula sp. GH36]